MAAMRPAPPPRAPRARRARPSGRAAAAALVLALAIALPVALRRSAPSLPVPTPSTPAPAPRVASPATDTTPVPVAAATVVRIVDGDTVQVRLASGDVERVRLIGVDTPERGRPLAAQATRFTAAAAPPGRTVYLERDVDERDRYGRLLAYVWLERPASRSESEARRAMLNARLLLAGYAVLLTVPPNVRYVDLFTRLQAEARRAGAGLWAAR
jgi:micrococcal nuclease